MKLITVILSAILFLLTALVIGQNDIMDKLDKMQPAVSCKHLNPNGEISAIVYNRFDNEIRIECEGNNSNGN